MTIVPQMLGQLIRGNAEQRVTAVTTLIMWFAMGAFVTSTITDYVLPAMSGEGTSIVGGLLVALTATKLTA